MDAGDTEESSCKKRKLGNDMGHDKFQYFFNEFKRYDEFMKVFRDLLRGPEQCLLPTVLEDCDAMTSSSFNECRCVGTADTDIQFHFGAFFLHGVTIYNDLLEKKVPEDPILRKVSEKLLTYLLENDCHEEIKNIGKEEYAIGKTQVMVTLAEHYFSRLSFPHTYVMDKFASKSDICRCGRCRKENLQFDDTSIGNPRVWHGSLDILFESGEVAVNMPVGEALIDENDDSPGGCSAEEVELENLNSTKSRSQVLAQTIVFAMLHKQRHPELKHFLIPTAAANGNAVKFFFYDGENDILLESKRYSFLWPATTSKMPESLVFETVIASWLVLNYKILSTGPYEECISKAPKSKFREFAKQSLQIYEDELQFKNVKRQSPMRTFSHWERFRYLKVFEWPSSLSVVPN